MDHRQRIIVDPAQIADIAAGARRVAVLGIKPESERSQPAHYVPAYLVGAGIDEWLMMATYGSNLYVGSGLIGGQPRVWQTNVGGSVISHSATAARIPSCMAVYANRLYVGNSGDGTVATRGNDPFTMKSPALCERETQSPCS